MILLDTNVLSELMRQEPDPGVLAWLDSQPSQRLYFSAVTRAEIELGVALLPDGARKEALRKAAASMLGEFPARCLPFDDAAASHYAVIVAARGAAGRPISVQDAEIAAIALTSGFGLATRNDSDFTGIPGLTTINPWTRQP
jgi:toxin FitB